MGMRGRGKARWSLERWGENADEALVGAPRNRDTLWIWLGWKLDLRLPRMGICKGHASPLDYLCASFFEHSGDRAVWACRGGGKTMLGAVATLLDLLFKPGVQIRILGGSLEQSEKMYAYLRQLIEPNFEHLLAASPTRRRMMLTNGSRVEILAQSDRSVRGQRVQKLRCDEVELFDPDVWSAAQLVTRSVEGECGGMATRGTIEAFSTMHKPGGLMQEILESSGSRRTVFSWCVWDVIEKCPEARVCGECPLWGDCGGKARAAEGFMKVDDVIAMQGRVGQATWEHEMLCMPPRWKDAVFAGFRVEKHVRRWEGARVPEMQIAGVDFGFAGAFVCLWIAVLRDERGRPMLWVLDELVARQLSLEKNIRAMRQRNRAIDVVYCDVAGRQTNSHSGKTDVKVLQEAGFTVRTRAMGIDEGLRQIDDLLEPAIGEPRLLIDPACVHLIAAMQAYRRDSAGKPIKDGTHDHPIDALRYAVVNQLAPRVGVEVKHY